MKHCCCYRLLRILKLLLLLLLLFYCSSSSSSTSSNVVLVANAAFLSTTTTMMIPSSRRIILLSNNSRPSSTNTFTTTAVVLFAKKKRTSAAATSGTVSVNRVAYRNYEVLETLEAGISLVGTEVKSVRDGKLNIRDGYIKPLKEGRCYLHNVHIGKNSYTGEFFQHEERRVRTLLLHRNEARKWAAKVEMKGMTVVPLKAYFDNKSRLKLQIGLCRGKNVRDKRDDIKKRDEKREMSRISKNFRI